MARPKGPPRPCTDDLPSIDIRRWKRSGLFTPGGHFITTADTNDPFTPVDVKVDKDLAGVMISYRTIGHQVIRQRVKVSWTPLGPYGAQRPFFRCPDCGERVAILYIHERIVCRKCHGLIWLVENENPMLRAERGLAKVRRQLGLGPGFDIPLGSRPKGMRQSTYLRLLKMHKEYAQRVLRGICREIGLDPDEIPSKQGDL